MLAVQQPSMGSSKPPNLDTPFGFTFDTGPSFPFPSPPAPAPGPSLLDDNESRFLDSFFDGVNSDHFSQDFFTTPLESSGIGFGWEELPPAFMGTTSSLGQPSLPSFGAENASFPQDTHGQMETTSTLQPDPSSGMLAAGSVLQPGANGHSHSLGTESFLSAPQHSLSQPENQAQSHAHSVSNPSFNHATAGSKAPHSGGQDILSDTLYTEMVFGRESANLPPIRQKISNLKVDFQWGSDTAFASQRGFVPERHESLENIMRPHIQSLKNALTVLGPDSANNTAPSSPVVRRKSISEIKEEEQDDSRPFKRRKSKFQDEGDDQDDSLNGAGAGPNSTKRRKPSNRTSSGSPTRSPTDLSANTNGNSKRRKSSGAEKKSGRENLTEEQKRENHIRSEQKRRTLIREGFEDLNELVPGLKGGGFSKSTVLIMTAEWLEELLRGNEVLRSRIHEMEGR